MKSNTAAEPQTIWWSDSAYIIFRILWRGLFVLLSPLYNREVDIKWKRTELRESGKVICDMRMFLFFFCVCVLFCFAFCIFLHAARLPGLQFAPTCTSHLPVGPSACLRSRRCANNHIDVTFYTVRNNKTRNPRKIVPFFSFFFLPASPN